MKAQPEVAATTGLKRAVFLVLGLFFIGLGALGAFLPVLPTTPFLLLASYFCVRSSPRLNAYLLRSPLFGPFLQDWKEHRGVRLHVKLTAITVVFLAVGASLVFGNLPLPLQILLGVLAVIGLTVIIRLPLVREKRSARDRAAADHPNSATASRRDARLAARKGS